MPKRKYEITHSQKITITKAFDMWAEIMESRSSIAVTGILTPTVIDTIDSLYTEVATLLGEIDTFPEDDAVSAFSNEVRKSYIAWTEAKKSCGYQKGGIIVTEEFAYGKRH